MAPNPLHYKENQWVNIGLNLKAGPSVSFARYVKGVEEVLWKHIFVVHESMCGKSNADNHDILNAYWCNLAKDLEELKDERTYRPVETPIMGPLGYWRYLQGPPVCENGDCGGVDSTIEPRLGARPMGLLKVEIAGDLPEGVEAGVVVQKLMTPEDPTAYPQDFASRSGVFHPREPGTYKVWANEIKVGGITYRPNLEEEVIVNGIAHWSPIGDKGWVEVVGGDICHIRVVFYKKD
jgi:hypothetical protein